MLELPSPIERQYKQHWNSLGVRGGATAQKIDQSVSHYHGISYQYGAHRYVDARSHVAVEEASPAGLTEYLSALPWD